MNDETPMPVSGRQPRAIQSALRVLELVAVCGAGVTAKQIASRLSMPPATVYRLVNILAAEGFLVRLPGLSGFALGRRIDSFVDAAVTPSVVQAAKDLLAELRLTMRLGIHLCVCRPDAVRYLDVDPDFPPPINEAELNNRLSRTAIGTLLAEPGAAVIHRADDAVLGLDSCAVGIRDPEGLLHACLWMVGRPDQIALVNREIPAVTLWAKKLDKLIR